jgi:hypothetical protein
MRTRTYRQLRSWARDMALGAFLFLFVSAVTVSNVRMDSAWSFGEAAAAEAIATRAIELTAPPGPDSENALVAAAQLRPAPDPLLMRRMVDNGIACLTFSLLVAFNLAFLRHLRRVDAVARRRTHSN